MQIIIYCLMQIIYLLSIVLCFQILATYKAMEVKLVPFGFLESSQTYPSFQLF